MIEELCNLYKVMKFVNSVTTVALKVKIRAYQIQKENQADNVIQKLYSLLLINVFYFNDNALIMLFILRK